MKYRNLITTSVFAASLATGSAWAMGPGGALPGACQGSTGPGGAPPMEALMNMSTTLNLTPEQQTAWAEFMETVQRKRGEMMGLMFSQRAAGAEQPAPEILRNNARLMENRVDMMRTMADALEKLYANLTPEQQAVLSQTIAKHEGG